MSRFLGDILREVFGPNAVVPQADLFADIAFDVATALDEVGQAIVADIQDSLSVDVEYQDHGAVVVRSAPGECPRRETGGLQESIRAEVDYDDGNPALTVSSDCPYARELEVGTDYYLPRPYFTPAFERAVEPVLDAVVKAVTQ